MSLKRREREANPDAMDFARGDAWKQSDPNAKPTLVDGKYTNAFLLRLNDWEMGALMEVAKKDERSAQVTARRLLREKLKEVISD